MMSFTHSFCDRIHCEEKKNMISVTCDDANSSDDESPSVECSDVSMDEEDEIEDEQKMKRVRFSTKEFSNIPQSPLQTFDSDVGEAESHDSLWWSEHDYDIFRFTARVISDGIHTYSRGFQEGVEKNLGSNKTNSVSLGSVTLSKEQTKKAADYSKVYMEVYDACYTNTNLEFNENEKENLANKSDLFDQLCHWIRVGHSRRGLERSSIPAHGKIRNNSRKLVIKAVLEEQKRIRANTYDNPDMYDEMLRRVSEVNTRPARQFALTLGQADEAAVHYRGLTPNLFSLK